MPTGHQFEIDAMKDKQKPLHPAWVGVGCILVAGLLGLGYLLTGWFLSANEEANWITIPQVFSFPKEQPYLFFKLIIAFVFLLLGSAATTLIYAVVHPPKRGKFDVIDPSIFPPPPKRRKR